jgi:hypothetical protein
MNVGRSRIEEHALEVNLLLARRGPFFAVEPADWAWCSQVCDPQVMQASTAR